FRRHTRSPLFPYTTLFRSLIINGSYWIGAALGAGATIVLLDPRWFPVWLGWRFAFGIGAMLGLAVIFFRRWIPESPRWLMIHGRSEEHTSELQSRFDLVCR